MTDDNQSTPDTADLERVAQQVGATDMVVKVSDLLENTFFFNAPSISPGRTSFESHRLNDMIDLVQNTNPAELEEAGNALWNARDAIKKAAEALKGHIGQPDWEGEAGEAFRRWGQALVSDALQLSDFADVAGTQITAAGTGLASVRSSMPPRDARADPKAAEDFPPDKRNSENEDYTAALKAEKHRQEAINQMNRLASFYAVSEQVLSTQEGPTFAPMPAVGVPQPDKAWRGREPVTDQGQTLAGSPGPGATSDAVGSVGAGSVTATSSPSAVNSAPPPHSFTPANIASVGGTSVEIASVGTLPPQTVPGATGPVAPVVPSVPNGGLPPSSAPFVNPPLPRKGVPGSGPTRSTGAIQGSTRPDAGRAVGSGTTGRTAATPGTPVGRGASASQGGGKSVAGTPGQQAAGRGVTGGTPIAGGAQQHRAAAGGSGAPAGRASGIVGGRPSSASPSAGPRAAGSPVVGGASRPPATGTRGGNGLGRQGVIGSPSTPRTPGSTQVGSTAKSGVVGGTQSKVPPRRGGPGFSAGGTGLVRGSQGSQRRAGRNEENRQGRSEPDEAPHSDSPAADGKTQSQ
ncbi:hypothetical protein [Streptomyces uncialis]|uniref:hypothetical protein n=1 Tax=Streptomyces uncialis TaxID=1048205 RepID=UPI00386E4B17|nr:hypothetical protein OG924_26775 [Streptomyces uncialis]